jgi:hypothetical protein
MLRLHLHWRVCSAQLVRGLCPVPCLQKGVYVHLVPQHLGCSASNIVLPFVARR